MGSDGLRSEELFCVRLLCLPEAYLCIYLSSSGVGNDVYISDKVVSWFEKPLLDTIAGPPPYKLTKK
jgi:hypothetical protein